MSSDYQKLREVIRCAVEAVRADHRGVQQAMEADPSMARTLKSWRDLQAPWAERLERALLSTGVDPWT